ncbi:heme-binding protein [Motiliproteus sp. MSK22-1]|uniref:GlcG/HbpS family heme-binding protein n=1 Tax=Motiliproteus sp. MSK22-1 TaxID=1897630 RepID=UPI0009789454|nr:heme-binding protein [Motiliproteus sp. MSK22-1]OMH38253.1 GlcG protein [Motiliproteus sp. MSK22-1]
MTMLTLENSISITQSALAKSAELNTAPLTVAILDQGGRLISLQRQDGASMMRPEIAIAKAWGAVAMGKSSRSLASDALERPAFVSALNTLAHGNIIPVPGGVLIRDLEEQVIGAIGISGDTSDIDELCAVAGVQQEGLLADAGLPL